ncbi:MAG TPA: hypothetical protein VFZ44_15100 [Pyrinomonadaceae bacterium]
MWVLCIVCFLAGGALGFFVHSRRKLTPERLLHQLDRLDVEELNRMTEVLDRTWDFSAAAPPDGSEDES